MAEIAVELEQALAERSINGVPGSLAIRVLAEGRGWIVEDAVCTSGPDDRPFVEQHPHVRIAIVTAGSFQYHSAAGRELMTPGALLLGNTGQCFECGHHHGRGDRCVSFGYAPEYFERIAADAGMRGHAKLDFRMLRLPPSRESARLVARAFAGLVDTGPHTAAVSWQELAVQLAAETLRRAHDLSTACNHAPPSTVARVTRAVRMIDEQPDASLTLDTLAGEAGLSPYHFLRTFERLTGVTPHQYVRRARLRHAAVRLMSERTNVLDIALDCGFGDVSNFNRAFRAEFGVSPRVHRHQNRIR